MNSSDDIDTFFVALNSLPEDITARVPLLIELLSRDGHESHEDIIFELGLFGDPSAIPAVAKAVETTFPYMARWNNVHEFQRKCSYALARIGTLESREALEHLTQHENPYLREYGRECLGRWPMPFVRS